MPTVTLTLGARRGKFGLVVVRNPDNTFNRAYRLTEQQVNDLWASGNGVPPGLTKEEWTDKRVAICRVIRKDMGPGDVLVYPNGDVKLKLFEAFVNGDFVESFASFTKDEYTGIPPKISVSKSVLNAMDRAPVHFSREKPPFRIDSIVDGVVTWQ